MQIHRGTSCNNGSISSRNTRASLLLSLLPIFWLEQKQCPVFNSPYDEEGRSLKLAYSLSPSPASGGSSPPVGSSGIGPSNVHSWRSITCMEAPFRLLHTNCMLS